MSFEPPPMVLSPVLHGRRGPSEASMEQSPLEKLQKRLLAMTGGTITAEEIGSDQRVSQEIVARIKRSVVRQQPELHSPVDSETTGKKKRIPKSLASRSFVIPCIFDGHRTVEAQMPRSVLAEDVNEAQASAERLRSLIDGIVSFQSLLQHFHEELFTAVAEMNAESNQRAVFTSMACAHLKETIRSSSDKVLSPSATPQSRSLKPPGKDEEEVVVTHAYDCCENPPRGCKPQLHYNNPFLDTTVHTSTHQALSSTGVTPAKGAVLTADNRSTPESTFFVPRWTCGLFHPITTPFAADSTLSDALQSFHSHLSSIYGEAVRDETPTAAHNSTSSETLLVQYNISRCSGDADTPEDERRMFTTIIYFVLTPTTGSFISGLKTYKPSTLHAPAGQGRSGTVIEAMRRAFGAASESFWHPLLDEVIVHNVASLTAVGAGEGADGAVAPATQTALNLIKATLLTEQKNLLKMQKRKGQGKNSASFCHSPPDGAAAQKVLGKARIAIQLAAAIASPYQWLLGLIHPEAVENSLDWEQTGADGDGVDDTVGANIDSALLLDGTLRDLLGARRGNRTPDGSPSPLPPPIPTPQKHNQAQDEAVRLAYDDDNEGEIDGRPSCDPLDTTSRFVSIEPDVPDHGDGGEGSLAEQHRLHEERLAEEERQRQKAEEEQRAIAEYMEAMRSRIQELEDMVEGTNKTNDELLDENANLRQRLMLYEKLNEQSYNNLVKLQEESQSPKRDQQEMRFVETFDAEVMTSQELLDSLLQELVPPPTIEVEFPTLKIERNDRATWTSTVMLCNAAVQQTRPIEGSTRNRKIQVEIDSHPQHPPTVLDSRGTSPQPWATGVDRSVSPIPTMKDTIDIGCQVTLQPAAESQDHSAIEAQIRSRLQADYAKKALAFELEIDRLSAELNKGQLAFEDLRKAYDKQREADASTIQALEEQANQLQTDKKRLMLTIRGIQQARQEDIETQSRASTVDMDERKEEEKKRNKAVLDALQHELDKLRIQCQRQGEELTDQRSRNQTLKKLLAMYEGNDTSPIHDGHFAAHCAHPHPQPSPQAKDPQHAMKTKLLVTSKNPKATDQLSMVSPPRTNSPVPLSQTFSVGSTAHADESSRSPSMRSAVQREMSDQQLGQPEVDPRRPPRNSSEPNGPTSLRFSRRYQV